MKFKQLTQDDKNLIKSAYSTEVSKQSVQEGLASTFGVNTRTIRNWAKKLGLTGAELSKDFKILVYDIETSRVTAKVWWTGKQYVGHKQLIEEPKIISISYKWLGESKIHALTWDKNHSDEKLITEFMEVYNSADMVVGQNNDRFDNRWINARAMKFGVHFNTFVKSFDIMKQTKRLFRLPSYSMDYITKFLNVENKQTHEGIKMWDMIQDGNKKQQKEYLQKMVDYNVGDIVSTEAMYVKLRKYMGHKMHFGVLNGQPKYSSPSDGTLNVKLLRVSSTPAGTLQYIMQSNTDDTQYKISHSAYLQFLNS